MIKNERQYRITKAQAARFAETLKRLGQASGGTAGVHPRIVQAQADAIRSQLADLERELREYETLRAGGYKVEKLSVVDEWRQRSRGPDLLRPQGGAHRCGEEAETGSAFRARLFGGMMAMQGSGVLDPRFIREQSFARRPRQGDSRQQHGNKCNKRQRNGKVRH